MKIDDFKIGADGFGFIGSELQRPECIIARRDGTLLTCDERGIMEIEPGGGQRLHSPSALDVDTQSLQLESNYLPNGLFAEAADRFLIANFGTDRLERLFASGECEIVCDRIDGVAVGKVNFVTKDSRGRIWFTVSTRRASWLEAINDGTLCDGYVAILDENGPRIVAEGLSFANECRLDATERHLFVAETRGRRITRFSLRDDGSAHDRTVYGDADLGGFPDGIAFDAQGNLWGTLIGREQIYAIDQSGRKHIIADLGDRVAADDLDRAVLSGTATLDHFVRCAWPQGGLLTSITFGGSDLGTVYVGNLTGSRIPWFRSPISGLALTGW
jgi:sugar lactone lactonase YvrE